MDFLVCEGVSNDDVGVARGNGHLLSGDTAGCWLQSRRFRQRKVEGASTVERLCGEAQSHWCECEWLKAGNEKGVYGTTRYRA